MTALLGKIMQLGAVGKSEATGLLRQLWRQSAVRHQSVYIVPVTAIAGDKPAPASGIIEVFCAAIHRFDRRVPEIIQEIPRKQLSRMTFRVGIHADLKGLFRFIRNSCVRAKPTAVRCAAVHRVISCALSEERHASCGGNTISPVEIAIPATRSQCPTRVKASAGIPLSFDRRVPAPGPKTFSVSGV
jgi:hypothetical protein